MKQLYSILFIMTFSCIFTGNAAVKRYVKPTASGTQNGSSWANAKSDLQQVVNASAEGDTIWVAAGTYTGGFTLKQGVQIYGGFAGFETFLKERKLPGTNENQTILDGNNTQRVVSQDVAFTVSTVLDGFVIQNGSALYGAGVSLKSNSVLRRCIVRNNQAGEIRIGDYVSSQGGVVFRIDKNAGKVHVVATQNHGQTYQSGKGTVVAKGTLDSALLDLNGMANTKLMSNARAATAIAEYVADVPADGFTDWYIPSAGEWGMLISGGPFMGGRSELCSTVEQTLTSINKQTFGTDKYWSSTPANNKQYPDMWYANFGTMSLNSINALQYNCLRPVRSFALNIGYGTGGGVYATSGARIEGCLVYNNTAAEGSGVYTIGNVPVHFSTIVSNKQSSADYANSQGMVTVFEAGSTETSSITNSIIWGNKDFDINPSNINFSGSTRILYTALESSDAVFGTGNVALPSQNNLDKGVQFKNPNNLDFNLLANSICANIGDKRRLPKGLDTDLNGVIRTTTACRSMGAYESDTIINSVTDLLNENEVMVYPNPVHRGTMLTLVNNSNYSEFSILIIDLVGQVISTGRYSNQTIQLQMPNVVGTYFLKVLTKQGESVTKKILVQ